MSIKRAEIYKFIDENFGVKPEFLFSKNPSYAVFREKNSKKWFGVLMNLDGEKLGLNTGEKLILNLKCDPNLAVILRDDLQILSAYHMNKKHWISVNLSSNIDKNLLFDLIKESFYLICRANSQEI